MHTNRQCQVQRLHVYKRVRSKSINVDLFYPYLRHLNCAGKTGNFKWPKKIPVRENTGNFEILPKHRENTGNLVCSSHVNWHREKLPSDRKYTRKIQGIGKCNLSGHPDCVIMSLWSGFYVIYAVKTKICSLQIIYEKNTPRKIIPCK